jgi:drug/metabolite transporter (DMT)-like permease
LAALILREPITVQLAIGLVAVCAGLFIATTEPRAKAALTPGR